MANTQEIELFIDDNGELKVHIKGIKGPGCTKVMNEIAKELGTTAVDVEHTSEFYEKPAVQDKTDTKQRLK